MLLPNDKMMVGENNKPEKKLPNTVLVTVINNASLYPIKTNTKMTNIFANPMRKNGNGFGIKFSTKKSKDAIAVKMANNTNL